MIFINIKCQWDFIMGKNLSLNFEVVMTYIWPKGESVLKRTAMADVVYSTQTGIRLN